MEKGNKNRSDATSRSTDYKEKRNYRSNRSSSQEGESRSYGRPAASSRGGYGRKENEESGSRRGGYKSSENRSTRGGYKSSEERGARSGYKSSEERSTRGGYKSSEERGARGGYKSSESRGTRGGYKSSDEKNYKSGEGRSYKSGEEKGYREKKSYGQGGKSYSRGNSTYKKNYRTPDRDKTPEKFLNSEDGSVRLNKFIANSGICSRREADTYIETGLVTVNGKIVTELGTKVSATDDIRFNGQRLKGEMKVYVIMNKPKGYVTTLNDPHAEKTVMDLISREKCPQRVFPIGRLDKATTGVLMLTNDGAMAEKLMHPSFETKKIYHVTLDKNLKGSDFNAILEGIHLEDGEIHADSLSYVDEDKSQVGIEIHSGRNRIVRRIFEHLGYKVKKLDRVYFAGFTKKNLKRGQWRFLTQDEINMLMMSGGAR